MFDGYNLHVKGHVYAYTFNQYEASINNTDQDQSSAFYHLLLLIRSQIPTDAKISKENVLQIERTRSKIILKMHYTLLEDTFIPIKNPFYVPNKYYQQYLDELYYNHIRIHF